MLGDNGVMCGKHLTHCVTPEKGSIDGYYCYHDYHYYHRIVTCLCEIKDQRQFPSLVRNCLHCNIFRIKIFYAKYKIRGNSEC